MKRSAQWQVEPGSSVRLAAYPTRATEDAPDEAAVQADVVRLAELQTLLDADESHAVLLILQGMDAAGKDPVTRHLSRALHLLGAEGVQLKSQSATEKKQDYLWRYHQRVPPRGRIAIFNRSWYEGVLRVRIEEESPAEVWRKRYAHFNDFERMLVENDVVVLKCFLHVSKDEQKERLEERLRTPEKSRAFSEDDLRARAQWDEYQAAYEDVLARCSSPHAPWHIIPADDKPYRDWAVGRVLVEALEGLDLRFPEPKLDTEAVVID